ncbi:delta-lactam-biosynthetic de-N-acetylase [Sediminibacillus dalangtanensis]|uniref:Delta-lactam-biosynthetic de-N-acetylase n=1 Tax=Sediminibacillus dalangtanensis TaxID=2729421 RepID=A0ABX7VVG0_9BACI|nr:delta-lactam-biosynthetic de-N-acetylase [Sediminibacillus dalangtanensis]QTM98337.1 delta-lactam-biosynthetic de-N-acetylase [Sediminibacillus dalangtanensis]
MYKFYWVMLALLLFWAVAMPTGNQAEGYGWGYKKNSNHQPPEVGKYDTILEDNGGYYLDKSGEKVIYLTFDNGYEQGYTDKILDVLKKKDVPAAFFVTGHYVDSSPELVKRMVDEGHIVGNHSYHHPDFTKLSKKKMKEELDKLQSAVAKISDQKTMQYVRPPKGTFTEQSIKWANELGYIHMFWSLAFVDWNTNSQKGWQSAYQQVIDQVHPGAVILLHTVSEDNAEALEYMIDDMRKQGYTFKSLDDLVMKDLLPRPFYQL